MQSPLAPSGGMKCYGGGVPVEDPLAGSPKILVIWVAEGSKPSTGLSLDLGLPEGYCGVALGLKYIWLWGSQGLTAIVATPESNF